MNESDYLDVTMQIMQSLGVPIRDTYDATNNFDDYCSNGKCFNGPRRFRIYWSDSAPMASGSGKPYEVQGRKSIAYDSYRIVVPERFNSAGRSDPIVHECVHFLQHTTLVENSSYIRATNESGTLEYAQYLAQRVELEAHLVQIEYIRRFCNDYFSSVLAPSEMDHVNQGLVACAPGAAFVPTMQLVVYCRNKKLI